MTAHLRVFAMCLAALIVSMPVGAQTRADLVDELDILAVKFLDKLQILSIENDVEYCGYFGVDATGKLTVSETARGRRESCLPPEPPADFDILASFHTHGAFSPDLDSEVPSVDDMLSDFDEGIDGYIATPGGRVWLNLVDEEIAILLCDVSCVVQDPKFRPCRTNKPDVEYTLPALKRRENSDHGAC